MLLPDLVAVEVFTAPDGCDLNIALDPWEIALDQRVFGPRRLLVAFADPTGQLVGVAHTERQDPPELTLGLCIEDFLRHRPAVQVVAYCDEPVDWGLPPPLLRPRWELARAIATVHGLELLDWVACDDHTFRSSRLALELGPDTDTAA